MGNPDRTTVATTRSAAPVGRRRFRQPMGAGAGTALPTGARQRAVRATTPRIHAVQPRSSPDVAVVGAGTFGMWPARHCPLRARRGLVRPSCAIESAARVFKEEGGTIRIDHADLAARPSPTTAREIPELHFPDLVAAPIDGTRACHCESSVNGNFVIDTHPDLDRVSLAGARSAEAFTSGDRRRHRPRVLSDHREPEVADGFRLKAAEFESRWDRLVPTPIMSAAATLRSPSRKCRITILATGISDRSHTNAEPPEARELQGLA